MIDYVLELVRGNTEVKRNYSGANLGDSIIQLEVAMAVERQYRYTVAFSEPDPGEAGRQAINPLAESTKCVSDGSAHDCLLVRGSRYRSPQTIQNRPGQGFSGPLRAKKRGSPPPLLIPAPLSNDVPAESHTTSEVVKASESGRSLLLRPAG